MKAVFADTGYWIALSSSKDNLHQKALQLERKLIAEGVMIYTSEMIWTEYLNHFPKGGLHIRRQAVSFISTMLQHPNIRVIPQDSGLFARALRLYSERDDQGCSLTDCSCFVIMRDHQISEALSHDKDFEAEGFRALLRE
jgi:predicted nucleic acid-binding protein